MKTRIFTTGGTFDKRYDKVEGTFVFNGTAIRSILDEWDVQPSTYSLTELFSVDSLEMTDDQRSEIAMACSVTPEPGIVITHGTDTMVKTARLLASKHLNKVIVLTGAMKPFAMRVTDAVHNLASAFTAVQLLPPGVYVHMNGKSYPFDNVFKDTVAGVFKCICTHRYTEWVQNLRNLPAVVGTAA